LQYSNTLATLENDLDISNKKDYWGSKLDSTSISLST